MGMHEFEAVVEASIRVLDKSSPEKNMDMRSLLWTLYQFQKMWDTGNTYFRLTEILLKHRFMYQIPVTGHPDYLRYQQVFDQMGKDSSEIESLLRYPDRKWDRQTNPETGGYLWNTQVYFTVNSSFWQSMVESCLLQGPDTQPAETMDLLEVVRLVVTTAEKLGKDNLFVIEWWYPLLGAYLYVQGENEVERLRNNKILQEIRAVIVRTGASSSRYDYGMLRHPPQEVLQKDPFAAWWFSLDRG